MRFFVRVISILLLVSLSIYTIQNPIFEEFDISKHEGEVLPLYFVKINSGSEGVYVGEVGFGKEEVVIETDARLKKGDVVTFYGIVENERLVTNRHHMHGRPNTTYYLSGIGLFLFLWLFLKEWKLDLNTLSVRRR
ncbi:MAG: hypothetical protein V3T58_02860 [Candidatus Hydrothermarchaeales archaeon]